MKSVEIKIIWLLLIIVTLPKAINIFFHNNRLYFFNNTTKVGKEKSRNKSV